jgi:hypothetical protein
MAKTTNTVNATLETIRASAIACVNAEIAHLEALESSDNAMAALLAAIGHEAGKGATDDQVAEWAAISGEWQAAYVERSGCDSLGGARAWQRLVNRIGAVKPQTVAALRKAELRAAKKSADVVNPAGAPAAQAPSTTPAAPADGEKQAVAAKGNVMVECTKFEAHILAMMRAGKFAQVHEALRGLESTK